LITDSLSLRLPPYFKQPLEGNTEEVVKEFSMQDSLQTQSSVSKLVPLTGTLEERKLKFEEKSAVQRKMDELLAPTPVYRAHN
jgi:hypothetical protein